MAFHVFSSVLKPVERKDLPVEFHISRDLWDGASDEDVARVLADMLPVIVTHFRCQERDQRDPDPPGLLHA